LFQSKEDKELGTIEHVPPRCNFYFDNIDYCRDIPMFLNPCYESYLHHDNLVHDRKVLRGIINFFDEFMNHPFKVQILNIIQSIPSLLLEKHRLVGMSWRFWSFILGID
jgi:hypothetical protein